jgi:hypothetical protein
MAVLAVLSTIGACCFKRVVRMSHRSFHDKYSDDLKRTTVMFRMVFLMNVVAVNGATIGNWMIFPFFQATGV